MSTRAWIAIKEGEQYKAIYHHCDSYPEYLGELLKKHYTSVDRVRQVMALGNASYLSINLYPPVDALHSHLEPHPNTSVFHIRDLGHDKDDSKHWSYESKSEMLADFKSAGMIAYLYIFNPADQSWEMVINQH